MSLVYLDSSALVKLVAHEPESRALFSYLETHRDVVSSALARVEVLRAVSRAGRQGLRKRALGVLSRVVLIAIEDTVLKKASSLDPSDLRSLDAIHLATALALQDDLEAIVSYDERLNVAAQATGLPVATPR